MPPKNAPSQAGKFKPKKRVVKKSPFGPEQGQPSAAGGAYGSAVPSGRGGGRDGRGRGGRFGDDGGGRGGRMGGSGGRGGGGFSGRGGRDGRGGRGGRGRGRGRFVAPTGAAFFTGAAVQDAGSEAKGLVVGGGQQQVVIAAGKDGAVIMPGMEIDGGGGGGGNGPRSSVAGTAAESIAAAARARHGEGEEFVVAEMNLDERDPEDEEKRSALDNPSSRFGPSLFDDEQEGTAMSLKPGADNNVFVYDSDSSDDMRKAIQIQRREKAHGGGSKGIPPARLPFEISPNQLPMYDCQIKDDEDDGTSADAEERKQAEGGVGETSQLRDPPMKSPFLDLTSPLASRELKQLELDSWFFMKFPTRLPHLDASSSFAGDSKSAIKDELARGHAGGGGGDDDDEVEVVGSATGGSAATTSSSVGAGGMAASADASGMPRASGYDDTLQDVPSGRYGKILVYKSGRTELVVGGGSDGAPEVRMLIHEGLQCGFRQEVVSIDPEEAMFVPLGDVTKSVIVTPDVESAFGLSS